MKLKLLSIAVLMATSVLFSCQNDSNEDNDGVDEISSKVTELNKLFEFQSWQEMMNYYVSGDGATWLGEQNVKVLSYEYKGTTKVTDALLTVPSSAMIPVYSGNTIVSVSTYSSLSEKDKNACSSWRETCLGLYKGETLGVIQIKCRVNDKEYTSQGYVSKSIMVYDDILMNTKSTTTSKAKKMKAKARIKASEEINSDIEKHFVTDEVTYRRLSVIVARAFCSFTVRYKDGSFLVNDLCGSHATEFGKAAAKAEPTITGNTCVVHYSAAAGPASMTISWNGISFTTSSDGNVISGSESYSKSDFFQ